MDLSGQSRQGQLANERRPACHVVGLSTLTASGQGFNGPRIRPYRGYELCHNGLVLWFESTSTFLR